MTKLKMEIVNAEYKNVEKQIFIFCYKRKLKSWLLMKKILKFLNWNITLKSFIKFFSYFSDKYKL